ncbi:MAG: fibronectin type III domain-containing protein [Clostridiales bacterium]|nr:fibronectin type III domain-containing protein [Clostridiales bacterium]
MAKKVASLTIGLQTGSDRLIYATWTVASTLKNISGYKVAWYYHTGDSVWFVGQEASDTTLKQSTYTAPSNAVQVKVKVKPVSKTKSSGASYWTGAYTEKTYLFAGTTPETPSAPTVTIEDYKLTARLDTTADYTDRIEFQVVKDDSTVFSTGISSVTTGTASYSCSVTAGSDYKVRCRAINDYNGSAIYSDWGDYSSNVTTVPNSVTSITAKAESSTSVSVTFPLVSNAESYTVEYTTEKYYFDSSNEVQSLTGITASPAYVTGLDSGQEWWFRVKAVNTSGDSGWSDPVSVIIGSDPEAPTTWSSTTSAITGETVTLYWVHNSEDGSKSKQAQIELILNGTTSYVVVTNDDYDSEDEELTHSYTLDLSGYGEGATVYWRVRTMGVTDTYGDWSVQRQIDVYAPATLMLTYDSTLTSFPYNIVATAGPSSQTPMCYTVTVTANSTHETTNEFGSDVTVNAGEIVFSETYYTSTTPYTIALSADNVSLANSQSYTVTVTVATDVGLTAETSFSFSVEWDDVDYDADAGILIDKDKMVAYISPFAVDEDDNYADGVTLSVYRREFDGTFTEIATGLENNGSITVTDPHPALDYARYRIVVKSTTTGAMSYDDLPGEPVGLPYIVMQWDETWSTFNYEDGDDEREEPAWSGSMVKLLYNIDTTEEHSQDVSLVEYIGREHPVSYYGTQKGETATWSCVIVKDDTDTLYALRRLAVYQGDVYVRNPSGVGYWAQVTVSISDTHAELTIPVSFAITRVEGGM